MRCGENERDNGMMINAQASSVIIGECKVELMDGRMFWDVCFLFLMMLG